MDPDDRPNESGMLGGVPNPLARQMITSLRDLRSFVAAAETGSMSRAARVLRYSQPAVSLHIQSLERQVGVRLFDRGAHGLDLTDEGAVLLVRARRILALCDLALGAVTPPVPDSAPLSGVPAQGQVSPHEQSLFRASLRSQ